MMVFKPDRDSMITILTLVFVTLWVIVTIARIWVSIPQATILDTAIPLLISYWFATGLKRVEPGEKEESGEKRESS